MGAEGVDGPLRFVLGSHSTQPRVGMTHRASDLAVGSSLAVSSELEVWRGPLCSPIPPGSSAPCGPRPKGRGKDYKGGIAGRVITRVRSPPPL